MDDIFIDVDNKNKYFVLTGDLKIILDNLRIKSYLKSNLYADLNNSDKILIKFDKDSKEEIIKKLEILFERYKISKKHSEIVKTDLNNYLIEEKKFKDFSLKANKIRNNECDIEEFKEFTKIIDEKLVSRKLYPLQLLSSYHLAFSQNSCNFSVPGSGKTTIVYSAYTYLNSLKENDLKRVNHILIIGPLSSFGPWEDEYKECFGKKPRSVRLYSKIKKSARISYLYSSNPPEIIMCSYQGVPSMLDDLIVFLRNNKVMVVLDEAHKIKNIEGGIIADSVLSLSKYAESRVILTGTPLPNGYEDLINLYKFIWPNKEIIPYYPFHLKEMSKNLNDKRINNLIESVKPFFIRIKKSDLKLPPFINNPPIISKMGPIQKEIYDFIDKKYFEMLIKNRDSKLFKDKIIKAKTLRLIQAATNPNLLKKSLDSYYDEEGIEKKFEVDDSSILKLIENYNLNETPSKFIILEKIIKNIIENGGKVVIWTIFIQNIIDLELFLTKKNYFVKKIYGATPVESNDDFENIETREKIIDIFNNPNSPFKILIANPFSVSESISLHKSCHNAIYLDRNFNAGQFIQSKDRIHRVGLKENDVTNYYYILSENSIDESIEKRLKLKEERMLNIIESEDIPLFNNVDNEELGDSDIKQLIDDYVKRINKI